MDFLHPECPDRVADLPEPRTREELLRYGPTEAEAALRFQAEVVTAELAAQNPCAQYGLSFEIRPLESERASAYNVTNENPATELQ